MAIDNHKPVHVFNTEDGKWYYYDYTKSKFTEYPAGVVPKLTKNFEIRGIKATISTLFIFFS